MRSATGSAPIKPSVSDTRSVLSVGKIPAQSPRTFASVWATSQAAQGAASHS